MKKLILLTGLFITSLSFAQTRYCDDIQRVDNFPRLNSDQFKRFGLDKKNKIDRILVSKDRKELYLLSKDVVVKSYKVAFGLVPEGHKQFEGDYKTPEGIYYIDGKNPKSAFYLSLHVSYPNKQDLEYAKSKGKSAGGDIMIHGFPNAKSRPDFNKFVGAIHPSNWTAGCIAVTDQEIYEIYNLVQQGTTIEICKMTPKPPKPQEPQEPQEPTEPSVPEEPQTSK